MRSGIVALAVSAILVGCAQAPKRLYYWEGFQAQLYEHFKGDGSGPEQQLLVLEQQSQKAQAANAALPPGFRAHLALLCLLAGRDDEARAHLETEKVNFPESSQYMDFLLKRMSQGKPR